MRKFLIVCAILGWSNSWADATELRVLTYNIHHAVGEDSALNLNRIASVIMAANADLVSLQEVDQDVPRTNNVLQLDKLAELTGMQGYFGKARNLDGGEYGNGVLVRNGIDVVSTDKYSLPNPDNVEPRVLVEMNLSLDSNPNTTEFKFFATHLMHDSSAGRIASAQYINGLVSDSTVPSILAGDMNFNPGSTAFNTITSEWTDLTNVNNSGKNRANQIDYVFYRSDSQWDEVTQSQFIINSTTNVASDHHPLLGVLSIDIGPATLVWNNNSGAATAFSDGFATGNGNAGVGVFPASPWSTEYNTGTQSLLVGYSGNATYSGSASHTIGSLQVGTNQPSATIAGRNGNGTVTTSGSVSLTVSSSTASTGDLTIGEGGYSGTVNWNSSGTLDVQGKLRVAQGGTGTLNQNNGIVVAGDASGLLKFAGVGINAGSIGTYNLNNGTFRPGGGIPGSEDRQVIVGDAGGNGTWNIGDGVGSAATALVETDDDIILGRSGGTAQLSIKSDGKLAMSGTGALLTIGSGTGGVASVTHSGGQVTLDGELQLGNSAGATGSYTLSGGTLTSANNNNSPLSIGRSGGNGKLRVEGTGTLVHKAEAFIGNGSGSVGRLEIIGSAASVSLGQLDNVLGAQESIFWQAGATGVAPLVITGSGALSANRVQLQDPAETSTGDGIALELDLSAIATSMTLTLIDNRTSDPITGFFEKVTSQTLYQHGAQILGTGFNGTVTISYTGSSGIGTPGNDVVLNLVALAGDYDQSHTVDAADYVVWRKGVGTTYTQADYDAWRAHFGQTAGSGSGATVNSTVPEPATLALLMFAAAGWCVRRGGSAEKVSATHRRVRLVN